MTQIDAYNLLIPIMVELKNDNKDIWSFHDSTQGYGFHLINTKDFISVRVMYLGNGDWHYTITKCKKTGNVLFGDELFRTKAKRISKVYDIIKGLERKEK